MQGTRRYQSCAVLNSYCVRSDEPTPPQDYMDDLESFLYILCEIMFTKVCIGKQPDPKATRMLQRWESRDETTAAESKGLFMANPFPTNLVDEDYWGEACVELLESFHDLLHTVTHQKVKIANKRISAEAKIAALREIGLNGKIDYHYDTLDALFNKTLKSLETQEGEIEARLAAAKAPVDVIPVDSQKSSASPSSSSSAHTARSSSKRDSQDVEDLELSERPAKTVRVDKDVRNPLPFTNATSDSD